MTVQTMNLELPAALFQRVSVQAPEDARELVTFLVESYAQSQEKTLRQHAYETYYAARTLEEEAEEMELLADFTPADEDDQMWVVELIRTQMHAGYAHR